MIKTNTKEFLLVDESPDHVKYFYGFLKKCTLEDKLIHAWNAEEAISILAQENVSDLKLIIICFTYSSQAQINLISKIRNDAVMKLIPIVVITNYLGVKQVSKLDNLVINALVINPLDLVQFKRIISLAGYTCEDSE